jgi:hypothetical protein
MSINENEVIHRFNEYLQELNVQDAAECLLEDCENEDLTEDDLEHVINQILIPEIVARFADRFSELDNCYDYEPEEDNLNSIWKAFVAFEGLSPNLRDVIASTINEASKEDDAREAENEWDGEGVGAELGEDVRSRRLARQGLGLFGGESFFGG